MTYIHGISENLARLFRNHNIQTHFKPRNTIRSLLVSVKDKPPTETLSSVVYNVKCKNCEANYVGETGRSLKFRLMEHQRPSSKNSMVSQHIHGSKHSIDWKESKVIDREDNWFNRGVREAIHIYTSGPSLNRDSGRHDLSPVYFKLLVKPGERLIQGPRLPTRAATPDDEEDETPAPPPPPHPPPRMAPASVVTEVTIRAETQH